MEWVKGMPERCGVYWMASEPFMFQDRTKGEQPHWHRNTTIVHVTTDAMTGKPDTVESPSGHRSYPRQVAGCLFYGPLIPPEPPVEPPNEIGDEA